MKEQLEQIIARTNHLIENTENTLKLLVTETQEYSSRERSIARTKLEETLMWLRKEVATLQQQIKGE